MKKFIKKLIPSKIILIFRNFTGTGPVYKSYKDAETKCKINSYKTIELAKVVILKNIAYKYKINSSPNFDMDSLRTLTAIGLSKKNSSLSVLDFGGGGGYHYTITSKVLGSEYKIKWHVVETETMVNESYLMADSNLKFFKSISDAKCGLEKFDLIFSSSALQYCTDIFSTLKKLTELNANNLFITRTPLIDADENIFTIQKSKLSNNGPGPMLNHYIDKKIEYPITFASKSKFEKIIEQNYIINFILSEEQSVFKINGKEINYYGYFCTLKRDIDNHNHD